MANPQHHQMPLSRRDNLWTAAICIFFALMLLTGGGPDPIFPAPEFQLVGSLMILGPAIWRLRAGFPSQSATFATVLIVLGLLLLVLQIILLPPWLWQSLPGREPVIEAQKIMGAASPWMPLSLDPSATASMAIALLPSLSIFFAVMTVPARGFSWLYITLLAATFVSLVLGVVQYAAGAGSAWYLWGYEESLGRNVIGTFRSPTFFASQLFIAIPIFMALGVILYARLRIHFLIVAIFMLLYMAAIIGGISLSSSRSGILLAMLSILLSSVLWNFAGEGETTKRKFSSVGLLFAVAAFFVMSQVSMFGILRLAHTDVLTDYRGIMFTVSWRTFLNFFPFGSGFGTFVPVYLINETPADLREIYANHAHNDWLEFIIEGGVAGALLLIGFVIWFGTVTVQVWRMDRSGGHKVLLCAANIAVLLYALHAIVDYGLRVPAHAATFALFAALLTRYKGFTISPNIEQRKSASRMAQPRSFVASSRTLGSKAHKIQNEMKS